MRLGPSALHGCSGVGGLRVIAMMLMMVAAVATDPPAAELPPLTADDVRVRIRPNQNTRFDPERAARAEKEGRATALCLVADNGDLQICQPISEEPAGWQFGEAAARLASAMRAEKTTKDGSPTAGRRFLFQMNFKLPRY